MIEAIHDTLSRTPDNIFLMESLYILYSNSRQYGLQFYFGLRLRVDIESSDLFELVKQHNLYSFIAGGVGLTSLSVEGEPNYSPFSRIPANRIPYLFEYDEWMVELEWKKALEHDDEKPGVVNVSLTLQRNSPSTWRIRKARDMKGVNLLVSSTDRIPVLYACCLIVDFSCSRATG